MEITTNREGGTDEWVREGIVSEDAPISEDGIYSSIADAKLVSIIIPAFNEKEGIVNTIQAIPFDKLEDDGYKVQLIVVDNGSDDGTADLAEAQGAEVIFEPQKGYGHAFKAGFDRAMGDIIVTADADGTYPIEDIPRLVKILCDENLEFLTTNRLAEIEVGAMSSLHRFGNGVLSLVFKLLYRANLKDSQSGMWVFRKAVWDAARLKSTSMPMSEELKIEAIFYQKRRWREVPIKYSVRLGEAKIASWKHGFENLMYLFKKRVVR